MKVLKTLIFISWFISKCIVVQSQQYPIPAPGAKWNVLKSSLGVCTIKYEYEKDTVMCGYTYSIVSIQNQSICSWSSPILIRSTGNLVYGRLNSCTNPEYLLYNFNLNVGDTFIAAANLNDTAIVTSASFVPMLDGSIRKQMILNSIGVAPWQYYWIEGIGDLTNLYYFYNLPDPNLTLLCFEDSTALIYQNTFWNTCDTNSLTGLNPVDESISRFEIYPNPANETFFIKYELEPGSNYSIAISDITGKLIKTYPIHLVSGVITTNDFDLPNGVLLCTLIQNDNPVFTKKIIKL